MNMDKALGERTLKKVTWRLIPFTFILFANMIYDRLNIGFAAMEMNPELQITAVMFGMISAGWFLGYILFAIPSNMMLHRLGANKWLTFIMVFWGLAGCGMFFTRNYVDVLVLRFLLGAFEAGFFPGVIYYFSYWFPAKIRARNTALFMMATMAGGVVSGPACTWIMTNIHWLEASGWRWVFVSAGAPTIILGIMTYFWLTSTPQKAKWLTQGEKDWLADTISKEEKAKGEPMKIREVFARKEVWRLTAIYFCIMAVAGTASFWMPQVIQALAVTLSYTDIGLLSGIAALCGVVAMVYCGRSSDKRGERKWHVAIPFALAAIGLSVIGVPPPGIIVLIVIGMIFFSIGSAAYYGPFWSIAPTLLGGQAAAVGIALINSVGNAAGLFANLAAGPIVDSLGFKGLLGFMGLAAIAAFLLTITMRTKGTALESQRNQQANKSI